MLAIQRWGTSSGEADFDKIKFPQRGDRGCCRVRPGTLPWQSFRLQRGASGFFQKIFASGPE